MTEYPKFAVIGGGSWATAIAKMLCVNLPEIAWYMRNEDAIEHIKTQHHNPNYLSSVEFNISKLKLTSNINEAVAYADYIIFAIPSAFLGGELTKLTF
jgi:glycerol-3-phosphate dehydrogenase (NAD(P)+)